jgi:hypothetical protein
MSAGFSDVVYHLCWLAINIKGRVIYGSHRRQILQIVTVKRSSHAIGRQSLHQELYSEDVHAIIDQRLNGTSVGENVVGSLQDGRALLAFNASLCMIESAHPDTGQIALAKFGPRLTCSKPCNS